jgi:hypothetical protein
MVAKAARGKDLENVRLWVFRLVTENGTRYRLFMSKRCATVRYQYRMSTSIVLYILSLTKPRHLLPLQVPGTYFIV